MRVAPAFFANQQYYAVFCLLSLECYIEKDERMAWKQRKKAVENLHALNENSEKSRRATEQEYSCCDSFNIKITILRKLTDC